MIGVDFWRDCGIILSLCLRDSLEGGWGVTGVCIGDTDNVGEPSRGFESTTTMMGDMVILLVPNDGVEV